MPVRSLFCSLLVMSASAQFLSSAPPTAEAMQVARAAILAVNTGERKAVSHLYTADAAIVDEDAPYIWTGSSAGIAWLAVVEKATADAGLTALKGELGAVHYSDSTETGAYLVVPVTYRGTKAGNAYREDGAFSFVLQKTNGHWLIRNQSWATMRIEDASQK